MVVYGGVRPKKGAAELAEQDEVGFFIEGEALCGKRNMHSATQKLTYLST